MTIFTRFRPEGGPDVQLLGPRGPLGSLSGECTDVFTRRHLFFVDLLVDVWGCLVVCRTHVCGVAEMWMTEPGKLRGDRGGKLGRAGHERDL